MNSSCIYLHFLDRELRESMGVFAKEDDLFRPLLIASLFSSKPLYCSLSFLFETCAEFRAVSMLSSILIEKEILFYISSHPTVQDFLDSRRSLYSHDASRYPRYFRETASDSSFQKNLICNPDSMTQVLVKNLAFRSMGKRVSPIRGTSDSSETLKLIDSALNMIGDKAVTFSAFCSYLPSNPKSSESEIRRIISEEYTRERIFKLNATILTGIPGLSYYDPFCTDFPCYDYHILNYLFSRIWHNVRFNESTFKKIKKLFADWSSIEHIEFCNLLQDSIYVVSLELQSSPSNILKHDICNFIKHLNWRMSDSHVSTFREAVCIAKNLRDAIVKYNRGCRDFFERIESIRSNGKEVIVLAVANDIEERIVIGSLGKYSAPVTEARDKGVYTSFDFLRNYKIYCVRSRMGSVGLASSELTIVDAIDELQPKFVISCGVLFGMKKGEQEIGDVLISEWVDCYEKQRVGEDTTIDRGDRITASPYLLQMASSIKAKFSLDSVRFGGITSGEKLIDNSDLKRKILSSHPEAIGGEMEGAGIVSACERRKVQWLLIKGICDWGENKNDPKRNKADDQKQAADNVVSLLISMFSSILTS